MHVRVRVLKMLMLGLCHCSFLPGFHVQMITFGIDEPVHDVLFASGATAAGAGE